MTKQIHLLLADDDKDDRFFFEKSLKEVSIPTYLTTVDDGEKLVDFLKKTSDLPFVIFLDLNMPRKNGGECLIAIKQDEKLKNIPIVIYSTSLHDDVAEVLYQNGAHYYLQKPNYADLPVAINKILTMLMENTARPAREKFVVKSLVA